jgi:transposase InsO family protein
VILELIDEAERGGARLHVACEELGLSTRTVERWRGGALEDQRRGPKRRPGNALSDAERRRVLDVVNTPEHRNLSPAQIVPRLADGGTYLASESTMRRIIAEAKQNVRRGRERPPVRRDPPRHVAAGPNELWSWDITWLRTTVRGEYLYLYMVEDVFSRKIVGWAVHDEESSENAAVLVMRACASEGAVGVELVLHADNGAPMRGSTLLATLERLGVAASYSRPSVSNDNPFVESLFRTLKYRPEYPARPFESIEAARAWVADFVYWHNEVHRHSAIRFVTPSQRHEGSEAEILSKRAAVYAAARARRPERWSRGCRNWSPAGPVFLNPDHVTPMAAATRCDDDDAVA